MISTDQARNLLEGGGNVVGPNDEKIGSIGQVFLDDQSGEPEWVTVKTGLFGSGESFVPLRDATVDGNDVRVPYSKDKVKDAPRVSDSEGHLSEEEEGTLFRHYGSDSTTSSTTPAPAPTTGTDHGDAPGTVGRDTSGPSTDSAMTRSEERLDVGTQNVATGKARLRKYVVTENVTKTVPVSREEVRVEREPITDANRGDAVSGGDLTSEEHEVTLHEDRVVTNKETVPVERVRADTTTVTEEERVNEQVRHEEIELDEDATTGRSTNDPTTDKR